MSRTRRGARHLVLIGLAGLVCAPVPSQAQAKDDFVRAFIELSQAVQGTTGQEGPAVRAALDAMAKGLAQWDAAVSRVEGGFAGAITSAAPAEAARMRATLGAAYLERGRVVEAVAQFDQAASLDASFAPLQMLRGLAHARVNRADTAASAFAAARRLDPGSPGPAYLFLSARRGAAAGPERTAALATLLQTAASGGGSVDVTVLPIDLLDDASVDAPLFVPAAYADGFRLVQQAKYAEALPRLRAAAAADPLVVGGAARVPATLDAANERARIARADALVASGDRAAARAHLLETVRLFPASGHAHWRLVRLQEERGDQAGALRAADAAARCAPVAGASIVYAAIGRLQHNALDLDAAARAYERRAVLAPQSSRAHLDLGTVYQAQDRLEDSLVEYLAAAVVDPASAAARAAAGQLRADMGDDEGAIVLLRAAVTLDANHGAARYALGRALLRTGRTDESRQELAEFARIQKAEMDAQRRQFEENSRAIESALQERPSSPAVSPKPQ